MTPRVVLVPSVFAGLLLWFATSADLGAQTASRGRVNTVCSPSHALETVRKGDGQVTARVTAPSRMQPGSFRLSKEFGILTGYTAFLAREGTDLSQPSQVFTEAYRNFSERAMNTRSGNGALNQSLNNNAQLGQEALNPQNRFLDANLQSVQITTVQQVNDRAFYRRHGRWVDSRLVGENEPSPRRIVEIGSEEFRRLATRLAAQNRSGTIALGGEVLLQVDGETVLVR